MEFAVALLFKDPNIELIGQASFVDIGLNNSIYIVNFYLFIF